MSTIRKGIIILSVLLLVLISSGLAASARLRVVVVANSIDYELASDFFGFLRNKGMEVLHSSASEFEQYKGEKFIVILGGPDAYNGVGGVVQEVLKSDEQDYLRASGNRKKFTKTNVWTNGQKVTVIAGSDRKQTQFAHVENRDQFSDETLEDFQTQLVTKTISEKWSFKYPEFYIDDNFANSVAISNDGLIGAKFESGFTYLFDKEGNNIWHKIGTKPISYAFYLYEKRNINFQGVSDEDKVFHEMPDGRIIIVSHDKIKHYTQDFTLNTSYEFKEDDVRGIAIKSIETADISDDGQNLVVIAEAYSGSSMNFYPLSSDEIQRKWYWYTKGDVFTKAKVSPNSYYISAIKAMFFEPGTYGWLVLISKDGEELWSTNLASRLIDVDISQNAECVATVGVNGHLYLVDGIGNIMLTEEVGGNLYSVAIAPDCRYLVVGADDMIKYYDIS